jgi:hypothetical protein
MSHNQIKVNNIRPDSSGSIKDYEMVTSNISVTDLSEKTYVISPTDTTGYTFTLPNEYDYPTETSALNGKRIVIHNHSTVTSTLTLANVTRTNVDGGNHDYYNRIYPLGETVARADVNTDIPAKTSIYLELELYYDSSVNLYNHFTYWRMNYFVSPPVLENLSDVNITKDDQNPPQIPDGHILRWSSADAKWINEYRENFEVVEESTDFSATSNKFYIVGPNSGSTIQAGIPGTGMSVGDRIKILNYGEGILRLESNGNGGFEPVDSTLSLSETRDVNGKGLVELIATASNSWTTIITPRIEFGNTSFSTTQSGEILYYDTASKSLIKSPYAMPTSDGTANQTIQTNGSGVLSWVTPSSGGATTLDGLSDVSVASPADNSVLVYNNSNTEWVGSQTINITGNITGDEIAGSEFRLSSTNRLYQEQFGSTLGTDLDSSQVSTVLQAAKPLVLYAAGEDIVSVIGRPAHQGGGGTSIRLYDAGESSSGLGRNYVKLKVSDKLSASYTLTLPTDAGTANQVLETDGIGGLSWTTPAGGGSVPSVTSASPSSAYTISTHAGIEEIYLLNPSVDVTVSIPSAVSAGSGFKYNIKNVSSTNSLTIAASTSPTQETIDGQPTFVLSTQYSAVTIVSDGSNWHII